MNAPLGQMTGHAASPRAPRGALKFAPARGPSARRNMVKYKVKVSTAGTSMAFTTNSVFIKLVGRQGESERTKLTSIMGALDFFQGTTSTFSVDCPVSLGELVLIELEKKALLKAVDWFPTKIEIESPEGDNYPFPIYCWIADGKTHLFREGKALRHFEDEHPLSKLCRENELEKRANDYPWDIAEEGIPHCMKAGNPLDLPLEVRFTFTKSTEFLFTLSTGLAELNLKGLANSKDTWKTINDIAYVKSTAISDYVREHWKEDAFFGHQYLNGVNPILIHRCTALPDNFPVTNDMLSIHGGRSFEEEIKNGNMFLLDYKNLDGVEANIINGEQQYLMAPLVLLHLTPERKLKPIAIQLKQKPSKDNPIFLPTDSEYDWLMAKIYVRSADFSDHQLNVHLLRTHLLAEVFTLSLLRNVPMVHPLYKLLIPHTRFTLQINNLARGFLISNKGFFNTYAASGGKAMKTILQRSTASLTYSSLCPPDDIKERGMDSVPGYYYRDDALQLWAIIYRFVEGILGYYYHTDAEVQKDSELQKWIKDIFFHGFLAEASTGVPQSLSSVGELVKFVTMVIFTGSAQHSAANSGQFDYGGWMPNTPITLRCPPPTTKGSSSQSSMLEALPDVAATANGLSTMWLLSKQSSDFRPLGHYKEEHFSEEIPCKFILDFKAELAEFGAAVNARNQTLEVPYTYMDPQLVENSVAV